MMSKAVWLGAGAGAIIGLVCGWWQAWDMRHGPAAGVGIGRMAAATLRLVMLMTALLAVHRWTGADRLSLVCGVAVTYTAVVVWRMKRSLAKKK
jgi:hypothetical protein